MRASPAGSVVAAVALAVPTVVVAGKAPSCPPGRYLVAGDALIPGGAAPDVVEIRADGTVEITSGCPARGAKIKGRTSGTRVRARWPKDSCRDLRGKVRFKAKTDAGCATLSGRLRAKKFKRKFEARRSACGDGIVDPAESCPLLEGAPGAPAIDAIFDYGNLSAVPESAIAPDVNGDLIVRTRVELVLATGATVGQVNALIEGVSGRIVSMVGGVPGILIDIPDPGSAAAFEAVVQGLEADAAIVWALRSPVDDLDLLPENWDLTTGVEVEPLDHHLAVRAPTAWNARGALQGVPLRTVVMDSFGDGVPDAAYDLFLPVASDFATGTTNASGTHGYHVLGILAGSFGGDDGERGLVTGIMPGPLEVRAVDRLNTGLVGTAARSQRALQLLKAGDGPRVFSTSLGFSGSCGVTDTTVNALAVWWTERVRALGLEERVLHTTSAGNVNSQCPGLTDPTANSAWAAAALRVNTDANGSVVPNLTNVLVVENATNTVHPPFEQSCLSDASYVGGHIGGIGTRVWSLTSGDGTGIGTAGVTGTKSGTSMATPQVAGLAAYLWQLDPSLTVAELRGLLLATARPAGGTDSNGTCSLGVGQPVIDAYDAVLSLDQPVLPTPASAPIRHAILDTNDDGVFDEIDLQHFLFQYLDGYQDAETHGPPLVEGVRDYGRADLNGDGETGGPGTAAFDLDRAGSTHYGAALYTTVTQAIAGVSVPFAEERLTDLEILCYYAYSDLWGGTPAARDDWLDPALCSGVQVTVDFPAQVAPGVATPLVVSVGRTVPGGGSEPLEGAYVELSAIGGDVTPAVETSNADGEVFAEGRLDFGEDALVILVQVRVAAGAPVIAEATVLATPAEVGAVLLANQECILGAFLVAGCTGGENGSDSGSVTTRPSTYPYAESRSAEAHSAGPVGTSDVFGTSSVTFDVVTTAMPAGEAVTIDLTAGAEFSRDLGGQGCGGGSVNGSCSLRIEVVGRPYHYQLSRMSEVSHAESEIAGAWVNLTALPNVALGDAGVLEPGLYRLGASAMAGDGGVAETTAANALALASLILTPVEVGATTTTTTFPPTTSTAVTTTSTVITTTSTVATTTSSSTTTSTTTVTTTTTIGSPFDWYRLYPATGPDGPSVTLTDQLRPATEVVDLGAVQWFLPPTSRDGVPVADAITALTCYGHPGAAFGDTVEVTNPFGTQTLTVSGPATLCVPTDPPASLLDHFVCYGATGASVDRQAILGDRFQGTTVDVLSPTHLCTVANKNDEGVLNAARYYTCYATTTDGTAPGMVTETNQFGTQVLEVGAPSGLCAPGILAP